MAGRIFWLSLAVVSVLGACSPADQAPDTLSDALTSDSVEGEDSAVPPDDSATVDVVALDQGHEAQSDLSLTDVRDVPDMDGLDDATQDVGPSVTPGFSLIDLAVVGTVRAICSDSGSMWAVGDDGLALRYDGAQMVFGPIPPTREDLLGVSAFDGHLVAVGTAGVVLRLNDGAWTALESPTTEDLYGVAMVSVDEFYAVGMNGTIIHYGKSGGVWGWIDEHSGLTKQLHDVAATADGGVYVVGSFGTLLEKIGSNWVQSQIAGPSPILRALWLAPDGQMFAVGTKGAITAYNGVSWEIQVSDDPSVPGRDLYDVFGFASDDVYAVGDDGAIVHYDGNKWRMMTVAGPYNVASDLRAVGGVDGAALFLLGAGRDSMALSWDGESWRDFDLGVTHDLKGVVVLDETDFIAVGARGLVLESKGGRIGTRVSGVTADLASISGTIAVGSAGTVLDLSGDGVLLRDVGVDFDLSDVWSGTKDLIVSSDGSLLEIDDGIAVNLAKSARALNAVCEAGESVFVAGDRGTVSVLDNGSLRALATGTTSVLRDIMVHGDGEILVVGDNGLILRCDTNSCDRLYESPSDFFYGIGGRLPGPFLVAGWSGTVLSLDVDGVVEPLDTGIHAVFSALDGLAGGPFILVGRDGALARYRPL